jgi:hypothetical protein
MDAPFKYTYAESLGDTAYVNLRKRLKDDAISRDYVTTKFTEVDSDEKSLFEFTNRVGAFIIYILIEAMRPSSKYYNGKRSTTLIKKKKILSTILLDKAIDMNSLFLMFCNLLSITGLSKNVPISYNTIDDSFFNLDTATFDKISEIFRQLYPGLYLGLEKFWSDSIQIPILLTSSLVRDNEIKCKHTWEGFHIYKLGSDDKYSVCRKCGSIIDLSIAKKD